MLLNRSYFIWQLIMDPVLLKTNILSITVSGLVMMLMGILVYVFREAAAPHMRFLLPIPPLGVAAYEYVFNMYRHFDGQTLPSGKLLLDLTVAAMSVALIFLVFSLVLIAVIGVFNHP
jgi:hypothetical protein